MANGTTGREQLACMARSALREAVGQAAATSLQRRRPDGLALVKVEGSLGMVTFVGGDGVCTALAPVVCTTPRGHTWEEAVLDAEQLAVAVEQLPQERVWIERTVPGSGPDELTLVCDGEPFALPVLDTAFGGHLELHAGRGGPWVGVERQLLLDQLAEAEARAAAPARCGRRLVELVVGDDALLLVPVEGDALVARDARTVAAVVAETDAGERRRYVLDHLAAALQAFPERRVAVHLGEPGLATAIVDYAVSPYDLTVAKQLLPSLPLIG